MTITDKTFVGQFAATMVTAKTSRANHPQTNWQCHVTVVDSGGTSHCTVAQTLSQGVQVYVHTGESDGLVLGTYRCDGIGALLEEWTHD